MTESEMAEEPPRPATERSASFAQTLRAVLWSFFGVRKTSEYEKDAAQLNPIHVIVAGVLAAVVFVLVLILVVRLVVG